SAKPRPRRENPEKACHDSNMQTGHGEQMKRTRLLKRLFDVLRRLMAQTENNAAQKILYLRRSIQSATNRSLHPGARFLGCSQDWISGTFLNQKSIFRIANKKSSPHILPREIGTHVELARIARGRNRFGHPEEFQFIAEFGAAAPANQQCRVGRRSLSFQLN